MSCGIAPAMMVSSISARVMCPLCIAHCIHAHAVGDTKARVHLPTKLYAWPLSMSLFQWQTIANCEGHRLQPGAAATQVPVLRQLAEPARRSKI
jgi:hypothetical protein